ncbi:MAG: O-antigen ligase family protein, partial [Candidatus Uhrbacteria bacterium]|nr:O-antigen ligase family protein [Candidatus Uhrbacteria bacterium]
LLLSASISVFIAPDLVSALGVWKAYFVEPMLLFFVVRHELNHNNLTAEKLFEALGVTAIILSVVGVMQWLTGTGLPIPWDIERRVTSVFDYPNALGLFLGPVVVIGAVTLLSPFLARQSLGDGGRSVASDGAKAPMKLLWGATVLLSSIAIILAQSEAAIVSVIATLLIAGFLYRKTRVLSLSLVVLSIVTTLLFPPLFQKLTLQDYSGQVRLSQWSETIVMLQDHWLLGAGLSGYPTVFDPYHQATHLEIFQYPHNVVLNIWVELGVLGLVAFGLLAYQVVVLLRGSQRPTKQSFHSKIASVASLPRNDEAIAILALLQMTIHGLVDVPYFKNDLAILTWILLAIVLTYARSTTPTTSS